MKEKLTKTQQKVLNAIKSYMKEEGLPPRYSDLAKMLGVSITSVWAAVNRLVKKGYITHTECARSIRIVKK